MKENSISRRNFLRGASAVAMASVLPGSVMAAEKEAAVADTTASTAARKGPKRGVSFYSYSAEFGFEKTLEDCFEDVHDMGAHGIEILANAHIANYPYPTEEWVNNWWALCKKYEIEPVEYGHWLDCRLYQDRLLDVDEAVDFLSRDLHLAHRLGFKFLRTKMTVKDGQLAPIDNWQDIILKALPLAERLGLVMLPEIHTPSSLTEGFINDYVDFIKKTGTKNFGLNIDFSVFRTTRGRETPGQTAYYSKPEDIIPLLPYIYCCHAKLFHMSDDFHETEIPYEEVLKIMIDHNWDGYLLSEYEGSDKYDQGYEVGQTLRKQHIMMKRILGD
jgi:sugar phosphate isomerase/epimerase